jgi:hypothetical protein
LSRGRCRHHRQHLSPQEITEGCRNDAVVGEDCSELRRPMHRSTGCLDQHNSPDRNDADRELPEGLDPERRTPREPAIEAGSQRPEDRGEQQQCISREDVSVTPIAADQEPSYLQLSDPEQRQPLAARRQKRLPRCEPKLARSGSGCLSAATARRPAAAPRRARASSTADSPPTSGPSRRDRQSPPDGMGLSPARGGTPLSCPVRKDSVDPISSRSLCLVSRQVFRSCRSRSIFSAAQTSSGQPTAE